MLMCVVGRNTFIGAGNTFTDFNLFSAAINARDAEGVQNPSNRPVLGGCVEHNCRIGAGLIFNPAQMIASDMALLSSKERRIIERDVCYEDSDHHRLPLSELHRRLYLCPGEQVMKIGKGVVRNLSFA